MRAVWPIYQVVFAFGAARAFWAPAMQAIVPGLVPRAEFPHAVALNSTLFATAVISGPALGGVLFLWGPAIDFGTCCALFVIATVLGLGLHPHRAPGEAAGRPAAGAVLQGLKFVLRQRTLLALISLDLFAVLFGGATALLPIFARDVLRIGPVGLGLLRSAPGLGAAITAGTLALRPIQRHAGRTLFAGIALFGASTIAFALSRQVACSFVALFLLGCGDMLSVNIRGILVQLNTPDAIRGRVSAINMMFIGASNELGEFESGLTARWFGAVRAAALGGVLTLGVVGAWMGLFPQLRRLDHLQ